MLLSRLLLHHFNLSQKFLYENTFCALYFGRKSWCFPPERHTLFRSSSLGLIHLHHQIYATGFLVRAAVLGDAYLLRSSMTGRAGVAAFSTVTDDNFRHVIPRSRHTPRNELCSECCCEPMRKCVKLQYAAYDMLPNGRMFVSFAT